MNAEFIKLLQKYAKMIKPNKNEFITGYMLVKDGTVRFADTKSSISISVGDAIVEGVYDKKIFLETGILKEVDANLADNVKGDKDFKDNITLKEEVDVTSLMPLLYDAVNFVAKDELRPVMEGVCVDAERVCGSDAVVLYFVKHNIDFPESLFKNTRYQNNEMIIPAWAIKMLKSDKSSSYKIDIEDGRLKVRTNNALFVFDLIEGTYPQYMAIIPRSNDKFMTVNRKALLDALKNQEKVGDVTQLTASLKTLNVRTNNPDVGIFKVEELVCDFNDIDFVIGVRNIFLQSILKVLTTTDVTFSFSDNTRAMIINDVALLMPVMTNV